MASILKTPAGKFRAQVYKGGSRRSKVFDTRKAAKAWAARQEYELEHVAEINSRMSFGDLLDKYAREVSIGKRGVRSEVIRVERLRRDRIASRAIGDLTTADFADWRDRRLREVKSGSVRRELEQMSAVLTRARKEWGIMSHNPLEGLLWPRDSPPRERRPSASEIEALRISAGEDLNNATARSFHAWMFAIETAMRAGEIAGLYRKHVDLDRRVAHLPHTKNGTARDVPLSREAVRLIRALPDLDPIFGLNADQISSLFRKVRDRSGVVGLRFHDSRHEAITRLAGKLNVLELARMVGHRDLKMLQRYYNATAEELAARLD